MAVHNLLEPPGWIDTFQRNPPVGFESASIAGVPAFVAPFDLLTTLDPVWRRLVGALTLHRLPRPRTFFAGTTVTEYMIAPADTDPARLVDELLAHPEAFLIIKDVPDEAVLVGEEALAWSNELARAAVARGFVPVEGQALAYVPVDFDSIDAFIGRMSHGRRKNIRRKLRSRAALTIENSAPPIDELYALYRNVYDQSEIHFDLLTKGFFESAVRDARIATYRVNGTVIGFNLCVANERMLIDKYIGFAYPAARDYDLYTVSWFDNLQTAVDRRYDFYVAGWTDPDVKRSLGARFTWTRHLVYARNPALRVALRTFRRLFESDRRWDARRRS